MAIAMWSALMVVALAWPGRALGMLDGVPLNGVAEATLIGLVVPALWWFDRRFLDTGWARALVVAVLVVKAAGLALVPQGLCAHFSTSAPFSGEIATIGIDEPSGALRSWDVRADWRGAQPRCTAIVDRSYRVAGQFPAWWVNLVDFIHPGRHNLALDLSGDIRVRERGVFSLAAADDMTLKGTIGEQQVSAAAGTTLQASLEPGTYQVALHATLAGERWSLMPLWNGRDAWSSVAFTTSAPGLFDGAAGAIGALTTTLTLIVIVSWGWFALARYAPNRALSMWMLSTAILFAWLGTEPRFERFAGLLMLAAIAIPLGVRHRNLRGAFAVVGVPWLAFFAGHALVSIGQFTAYSGDDWLAYQVAGYRIFMHGYWLEGGSAAFDYQPLYRWISGALHLIFGDSSVGEIYLDAASLLAGALLAFHVARTVAGYRFGLAAAAGTLATFTTGTTWYFVGRGLSEISAAGFGFFAAFFLLRARLGRLNALTIAGVCAVLMFYTRLNHLILAAFLLAWLLPLHAPAAAARLIVAIRRVHLRFAVMYGGLFATGVGLFMLRTWHYTGHFSLFYGTSLKNNDTGLRLSTLGSGEVWARVAHSIGALLWMNEPPHVDPRALLVVSGVLVTMLAMGQVPVLRQLPATIVIVTIGAMASALFVHTHNYPGRMSIMLVPLAAAATMIGAALLGRAVAAASPQKAGPRT